MPTEISSLPSNILTTSQYQDQQEKLVNKTDQLDRNAFLLLFTTQLKNQNPLDPMENEAFVSQLAQFSSLEAMTAMRNSIEEMANNSRTEKFITGSTLLGKKIDQVKNSVDLAKGGSTTSKADLLYPSPQAVFSVTDPATGGLVYREVFKNLPAGGMEIQWDGTDFNGAAVPTGLYEVELMIEKDGEALIVPLINQQKIKAVTWNDETSDFQVEISDGSVLNIADISRIED